jgi:uncharacterized oligopeptide transporter (OPT) family protein
MAVLRAWKGTLLEENIARTAGSIGEGIAAGAIFTLPAFVLAGAWPNFWSFDSYWKSTALIMVGSILGVLFISLVRRVMVEDPELPFPESVAASEIHKAGQRGAQAAESCTSSAASACSPRARIFILPWVTWDAARSGSAWLEARTSSRRAA